MTVDKILSFHLSDLSVKIMMKEKKMTDLNIDWNAGI
jgi:hypothetical protein